MALPTSCWDRLTDSTVSYYILMNHSYRFVWDVVDCTFQFEVSDLWKSQFSFLDFLYIYIQELKMPQFEEQYPLSNRLEAGFIYRKQRNTILAIWPWKFNSGAQNELKMYKKKQRNNIKSLLLSVVNLL